ncbi:hypothetical protein GCM10011492_24190 [Flexivirga endophytica]|uniref:Uncharacterized protein n=1 Tax=Flexivirga endophytica TaxID=1849103 RepID=A0A916T7E1_9MICO|nr:hypothetical protein [Flexivirga endophytica]GGB32771.1 hypothetical protein GCM10011492_24190 [Flexivirga endophytica]GHB40763.1 hypothetical protein GCM10008112_06580 [Flexivirga endophytica]
MTDAFGIPKRSGESGAGDTGNPVHAALPDQSSAMREAARNLLDKAVLALEGGATEKALGYLRKAERLPYDDHDAASPLSLAAHMYALRSVLDAYEIDRRVWLDAADVLLDPMRTWNPLAMGDFRHVLTVVQHDYGTTATEDRKLRALIAGQKVGTIREMQILAGEELCAVVVDLLEIVIEYSHEADALIDERTPDDY